jgi:hypothetical protein
MTQEWLKKLAELSNDKALAKRAEQLRQQAQQRDAMRARPHGAPRRGLFGAAFGHFFRFLLLFGLVQAAAMFAVAAAEGLESEPWGIIFHYLVWYCFTQPIFPPEVYAAVRDWTGVTPGDLQAFYGQVAQTIEEHQDILVYAVPAAAALILTLFFLPAINAGRRRNPIRLLVYVANLAVIGLMGAIGAGVVVLWLAALVFSFAGGGPRRMAKPAPPKPVVPRERAAISPPPGPMAPARAAVDRARRATAAARREPTVTRRDGGASWVRAR